MSIGNPGDCVCGLTEGICPRIEDGTAISVWNECPYNHPTLEPDEGWD